MKKQKLTIESKPFQFLDLVADLMILSVCWFVTSIPVITIGASTTAIYTVCAKLIRGEGTHVLKQYFKAFKDNFKKSTLYFIPFLVVLIASLAYIYLDIKIIKSNAVGAIKTICAVIAVLDVAISSITFAQLSIYENTFISYLKNSIILFFAVLKYTFPNLLILLAPILLLNISLELFLRLCVFFPFLGIGLQFYISTKLMLKTFQAFDAEDK